MKQIYTLIASCIVIALLIPSPGLAELEGYSYIDESIKGFRLYKRPKVTVPPGWKEHEAAGREIRGVFLVREGKEPQNSEVTIYAIAVPKETPGQSLESFIKGDIDNFKKGANKGIVTKVPNLKSALGHLSTYQFSYLNEGKTFVQTVTFGQESDHFLSFVLTGNSKAAHDGGVSSFKELLSKFR